MEEKIRSNNNNNNSNSNNNNNNNNNKSNKKTYFGTAIKLLNFIATHLRHHRRESLNLSTPWPAANNPYLPCLPL